MIPTIQYWRKMFVVKIDVIIAVYNAESTIEECVRSAINQEIPDNLIHQLFSNDGDNCKKREYTTSDIPLDDTNVHFDICICCYNDASTDKSLDILRSLQRESMKQKEVQDDTSTSRASIQTKLLVGTAPKNTISRGAGYARNQAIKLRDEYEKKHQHAKEADSHFLCILDSDDVMHPTRIAEQTCAMLSISDVKVRERTLMGCQFERIPKDATHHYSQWANSLSYERLYLEQFRECTLLQPTWFISKAWFESLGGYVEAPVSGSSSNIDDDDVPNNNFYRLVLKYENPVLLGKRKIPILHFSVLSKDSSKSSESFGHIDKKSRREDTFNIVSKKTEPSQIETVGPKENKKGKKNETQIDSEVLQQLPVIVCVAMYRTNGALEANVKSIGRTEGKDLWHII